jgi:hypothetical protein
VLISCWSVVAAAVVVGLQTLVAVVAVQVVSSQVQESLVRRLTP